MKIKEFILNNIPITIIENDEMSSNELKEERINICNKCEFFLNESCIKCGCIIETKIIYKDSFCPINKW